MRNKWKQKKSMKSPTLKNCQKQNCPHAAALCPAGTPASCGLDKRQTCRIYSTCLSLNLLVTALY